MTRLENEKFVRDFFHDARAMYTEMIAGLVEDADTVVEEAAVIFDRMIPDMAYVDRRDHPMASAVFGCSASLALYLALKKRGVDVHHFGRATLASLKQAPLPEPAGQEDGRSLQERFAEFLASAEASQRDI